MLIELASHNDDIRRLLEKGYALRVDTLHLVVRDVPYLALAGLPKGLTLHGLRKSLGVYLAEAGASTRQMMDVLGHDDIDHAELYSREASQVRLAVQGMDRVVRLVTRKPCLANLLANLVANHHLTHYK